MEQEKIWEYFQNKNLSSFSQAEGRLKFLSRQIINNKTHDDIKVLNIGVGSSFFEQLSQSLGLDIYSLDPDERSIDNLSKKLGMNNKAKVGYLQDIPFLDNSFDFVVVSEVLEHLSEEIIDKSLIEIHRVLKDQGVLIGTVPARENLQQQIVVCPRCGDTFHRWGHVQSFTKEKIVKLLSKNFQVKQVTEKYFVTWSALNWKGKIVSFLTLMLNIIGIRGSNNSIYFYCIKQ